MQNRLASATFKIDFVSQKGRRKFELDGMRVPLLLPSLRSTVANSDGGDPGAKMNELITEHYKDHMLGTEQVSPAMRTTARHEQEPDHGLGLAGHHFGNIWNYVPVDGHRS